MVKIIFKPFEEIIIHEIVKLETDEMIERQALNVQRGKAQPLYWSDRILFCFIGMEHTEDVVSEQLQNKVHWANLTFTELDQYQPTITSKGNIPITVFNVSNNKLLSQVTKWLHKQEKSDNPPF